MNEVRRQLLRVAERITRDAAEAENVVQEALLALHQADAVERPDAWLTTVDRNRALGRLRTRKESVPIEELSAPSAAEDRGTREVASWMPALVEMLDEPYRTAVREVDLEGVSQSVFARRHGLSPSGARTRVQRGRRQLHDALVACCPVRFEEGEVVDTGVVGCRDCR